MWSFLLLLQLVPLANLLIVRLNPMEMISDSTPAIEISKIIKSLIITGQYKAIAEFLKHPAYSFESIYLEACEKFTIDIVMDIINTVESIDDKVLLLSGQCISRASNALSDIEPEQISLLPVNPLSYHGFNLLSIQQNIFKLIFNNALMTYSDPKRQPINFYDWIRDPLVNPPLYFSNVFGMGQLLVSVMNPLMFDSATHIYKKWITGLFDRLTYDSMRVINYFESCVHWANILKLFIIMKSINISPCLLETAQDIKIIFYICASSLIEFAKLQVQRNLGCDFSLKAARTISQFASLDTLPKLIDVFNLLLNANVDMHPDWLISLLTCNLPASSADYLQIVRYISTKNPHYQTFEILSHLFASDLDSAVYREFKTIFDIDEMIMSDPDKLGSRPLQWRFRNIRSSLLPFTSETSLFVIPGLSEDVQKPYHVLFCDIMADFVDNQPAYSTDFTSIMVKSYNFPGYLHAVNFKYFLQKALNSFINIPELFSGDRQNGIIFNPILPQNYITIIISFIIHCALLGETVPFKMDKEYFRACLRSRDPEISEIYDANLNSFYATFYKISAAIGSKLWYTIFNYMDNMFNNYKSIKRLKAPSPELNTYIPEKAAQWMKKSFHENALAIRTTIYSRFKMTLFTPSEIYYILFER